MKLSGTYLDRLLICIIPWTFTVGGLLWFLDRSDATLYGFSILTGALWLLDSCIIFFKFRQPKVLRWKNALYYGTRLISPNDIATITPVTDNRPRWSFEMIELKLQNGEILYTIDKPHLLAFFNDKFKKTIASLVTHCPELESKIAPEKVI